MSTIADTIVLSTSNADMVDAPYFMQAATGDTPIQYTASDFRRSLDGIWLTEGVASGDMFKVTPRAAGGANFSVDIQPGIGVVQGDTASNQGKYIVVSNGIVNLTTPGAPASGSRNHHVIARIRDKLNDGSQTSYNWSLELLEDTGGGMPGLPNSAISLGSVAIASGQSNVSAGNITERRTYARVHADSYLAQGFVGGRRITGSNTLGSAVTTTEVNPTFMNSGDVQLLANRIYQVHVRFKAFGSSTGAQFILRIKHAATSGVAGTMLREYVHQVLAAGDGDTQDFFTEYVTTVAETRVFNLTAVRIDGAGSLQFLGGATGTTNVVGIFVKDMGPNKLTTTAS